MPGEVFLLYTFLYSCGRIVIEGFRTDSLYLGPFRVSQLLAALLIILSIALFVIRRRKFKTIPDEEFTEDKAETRDEVMNQSTDQDNGNEEPDGNNDEDSTSVSTVQKDDKE